MSAPNDGGCAFPSDYIPGTATTPGMSLRDYFAGQALAGMIGTCTTEKSVANLVPACWVIADQMLKAREAKP